MSAQIVLLHGAYFGSEIWDPLRRTFGAVGVSSIAPDVDHGDPAALLATLTDLRKPLYLVAHSLAGALPGELLADVSFAEKIQAITYLAAYVPRKGESAAGLAKLDPGAGIAACLKIDRSKEQIQIEADAAQEVLFGTDAPSEEVLGFLDGLRPQSIAGFRRKVESDLPEASSAVRRAYIVCKKDQAITPALQRRMAADAHSAPVLEMNSPHMPMVTHTEELARLLLRLWPALLSEN